MAHVVAEEGKGGENSRVLIDELGDVVDLIVNDHVEVILGVVLRNVLVAEFGRHVDGVFCCEIPRKRYYRQGVG